jgi:hypothetical protein
MGVAEMDYGKNSSRLSEVGLTGHVSTQEMTLGILRRLSDCE